MHVKQVITSKYVPMGRKCATFEFTVNSAAVHLVYGLK